MGTDRDNHWAKLETLRCSAPFRALPPALIDDLAGRMHEREFEAGETIIRQGEAGDCLYVMVEGAAYVSVRGVEVDSHALGALTRGDVAGEMALVTHEPRLASVVATTPVRALELPADQFSALLERHRELGMVLTDLIADRLGRAAHDGLGGKVFEGYRIVRALGRGGTSVVYEAEEIEGGGRVALKMMMHRLLYHSGAETRFGDEARIVMSLKHENVARLEKMFPAYRTWFLVVEFCDGESLATLLQRHGAFPEEQAKRLLGQLAAALEHVHAQGVVHRDIKPSNVMVTRDGHVKLMDFGFAKQPGVDHDSEWEEEYIVGTPAYMAPEQIAGGDSGPRLDRYGFGCIAYELIAGRQFFDGLDYGELLSQKLEKRVPPADEIGPGVGANLHHLLCRTLDTNPAGRPDSLREAVAWKGQPDADFLRELFADR